MSSYVVIKTIKGHRYRYRQRTWREGKRVRTKSIYLGPDGGIQPAGSGVVIPVNTFNTVNTTSNFFTEHALINALFNPKNLSGRWQVPWGSDIVPRVVDWEPDPKVLGIGTLMGLTVMTRLASDDSTLTDDGAWYNAEEDLV